MNKPLKKKSMLLFFALVIITSASFYIYKKKTVSQITYREIQVKPTDISITVLSTGIVQPENRLEIKPPIPGRVETVLVKEGQIVNKGQILAWMSSTERAALLDAARSKGAEELKKWEELYRPTPILAPIKGTLILRNVEPGQTFTSTDSVFIMSDRLTVKAQVDETDISQIKLGLKAHIVLDAYPQQQIPAQVDQIAFEAKTVSNVTTYVVDVLPAETPTTMRSGMTANVTFFIAKKDSILAVPNEAIKSKGNQNSLLIKTPEGEMIEKNVEIGISDGKQTEILQGINEGDVILTAELKMGSTKNRSSSPFTPMPPGRRTGGNK